MSFSLTADERNIVRPTRQGEATGVNQHKVNLTRVNHEVQILSIQTFLT